MLEITVKCCRGNISIDNPSQYLIFQSTKNPWLGSLTFNSSKIPFSRNQPSFLVCPCCTCEPSAVVYTVVFSLMEYELLLMDKRNLSFPFWLNIWNKIKTALVHMTRRRCKYWDRPYEACLIHQFFCFAPDNTLPRMHLRNGKNDLIFLWSKYYYVNVDAKEKNLKA